ncbi:hypothetical protein SESBI_21827, partial [Sesbania bispinosa]
MRITLDPHDSSKDHELSPCYDVGISKRGSKKPERYLGFEDYDDSKEEKRKEHKRKRYKKPVVVLALPSSADMFNNPPLGCAKENEIDDFSRLCGSFRTRKRERKKDSFLEDVGFENRLAIEEPPPSIAEQQNKEVEVDSNALAPTEVDSKKACDHDTRLDEEIGIYCLKCGDVITEIRDAMAPF